MSNFQAQAHEAVVNGEANEGAQRAVEADKLAQAAGLTSFTGSGDGQTFFAWGTELAESGKASFRSKAKLHQEQPFVTDLVEGFKTVIEAEKRVDSVRDMSSLALDATGNLTSKVHLAANPAAVGAPMSRWAMGQILNRANAPRGSLSVLSPEGDQQKLSGSLNQSIFSAYMEGAKTAKGREKQIRIRSRMEGDKRTVFAAQSPRSPIFDADKVLAAFAKDAHPTARGAVQYDGKRWKFSAGVMSHIEPTVGEIFEGSVWVSGADDGSSAIRIGAEVVRVRCVNLTTLHAVDIESIRHQGKQLSFEEKIQVALAKAHAKIAGFADVWAAAEQAQICENAQEVGVETVFKALVAKRLVVMPGVSDDDLVARLFTAWTQEQGYSKADILNAVTRAAHSNAWDNPWAVQDLAEQAGEMLYKKVYFTERDFSDLDLG